MRCRLQVALLSAIALVSCSSNQRPDTVAEMEPAAVAIQGATVLAGRELEAIEDATVVVEDDIITAVGPAGEVQIPDGARWIDASGLTMTPGFIDAHVHIGLAPPEDVVAGGVTTVRDLAWPPERIFPLVKRSRSASFAGPTIVAAGPMITAPGGYPTRAGWAPAGTGRPVESAQEARLAVREAHLQGASIIKVALNPPAGPTLSRELLEEIVETAHARGVKVTAHIYGLEELEKAIAAGVDELAHMLMSPEQIPTTVLEDMVAADLTVVPTLAIRSGSDRSMAIDNLRRFVALGGRVLYGTDLGNGGPRPGIDPAEIEAMAEAGMSALDIVRAATTEAAAWLGLDDVGAIQRGRRADLVGFRGDVTSDVEALSGVGLVLRRGRVIRGG